MQTTCKSLLLISLCLLFHFNVFAQRSQYTPSTIRVGTDLVGIGYTFAGRDQLRFEFNADADVHKYFVAFDYGYAGTKRGNDTYQYQNNGHYFRLGADLNLLPPDEFGNVIFIGLRYGRSFFSDQLSFTSVPIKVPYYGSISNEDVPGTIRNNGIQVGWGEIVMGVKVQLVKQLYIGFTGRYKIGRSDAGSNDLIPFEVPGFGTYASKSTFGFNYLIYYRFKLWDKPLIPKVRKKEEPADEE